MALPSVGQARMLGETLESLVKLYAPRCVAILGCAGGNGFERLARMRLGSKGPGPNGLDRIVGVDLNPQYIAAARERFQPELGDLELHAADIEGTGMVFATVDLIYAGLIFEYVEAKRGVSFVRRHLVPDGIFAAVLQRRDERLERVSPSPYAHGSLRQLETVSRWVEPEALRAEAESAGFTLEHSRDLVAGGNKRFALEVFRRRGGRSGDGLVR